MSPSNYTLTPVIPLASQKRDADTHAMTPIAFLACWSHRCWWLSHSFPIHSSATVCETEPSVSRVRCRWCQSVSVSGLLSRDATWNGLSRQMLISRRRARVLLACMCLPLWRSQQPMANAGCPSTERKNNHFLWCRRCSTPLRGGSVGYRTFFAARSDVS